MRNSFIAFSFIVAFSVAALAQEPAATNGAAEKVAKRAETSKPAATPKPGPLKPLTLTQEQLTRLANAQKNLQLAQAQVENAQMTIDNLIKTFRLEFVDMGFDVKRYDPDLRVIDQQRGQLGFTPKPEPEPAPAPAKETKPEK